MSYAQIFFTTAVVVAGAAAVVLCTNFLIRYFSGKAGCDGKISFRQFRSLYSIAPEKWSIDGGLYVSYRLREPTEFECSWEVPRRHFYFSLLDAIRFDLWRLPKTTEEEKREKNKKLAEVIECWQHDIDEYRIKWEAKE